MEEAGRLIDLNIVLHFSFQKLGTSAEMGNDYADALEGTDSEGTVFRVIPNSNGRATEEAC